MKIIKIDPNNPHSQAIAEAVKTLKNGGVLVYPSDTCYGLGVDMSNTIAVDKIYKIKQRRAKKPLSVIVKNISAIKKIALVEEEQEKILKKYLPGSVTFILLNIDFKNFSQNTQGVRIPKYKITQLIAEDFGKPFATTSANISGKPICYDIDSMLKQFQYNQTMPNLVLDAGLLEPNLPSTIVDLIHWPPIIRRQGSQKFEFEK